METLLSMSLKGSTASDESVGTKHKVSGSNLPIETEMEKIMTKTERVLEAFKNGEQMTSKQMKARFGIANPTATVDSLRKNGYAIYSNPRKNSKGERRNFFRLGTPTRRVVAAGYRALAAGLV